MKIFQKINVVLFFTLSFFSCKKEDEESPTKGHLEIYASETLKDLVNREVEQFTSLYEETKIRTNFINDREAIAKFLNDTTKFIIVGREFNDEEKKFVQKNNLKIEKYILGKDAIGIVVNKKFQLDEISTAQLKKIFLENVSNWNQIDKSINQKISIAIPNKNSCNYEVFSNLILEKKNFSNYSFVANSDSETIDFIGKNLYSIGIVGICSKNKMDTNNIKILKIENSNPIDSLYYETSGKSFFPYQAYIALNYYPISKNIYIYTKNLYFDVGTGFTSFLLSPNAVGGQKILGEFGMVPEKMPIRIVQLNQD